MLWLYRWIRGVLTVEFDADIPERFLNLCAKNGIAVWSVRRAKGKIRCRMGIRDFKLLPGLIRHSGIRIHILQKAGFPFLAARYRHRYGIPAGVILFFAFLRFMSAFIWSVETVGNQEIPSEALRDACAQIGVFEGAYGGGIDYKTASQELLLRLPGLSWCSMNLEGCRLTVQVSETKKGKAEDPAPSNIKAKADGIITKIDIKSGNCLVRVGDTVAKGDLLVSGILEQTGDFVHAAGTIRARTVREITVSVPRKQSASRPSGRISKKKALSVFGIRIPLYLGKTTGDYKTEWQVKQASFLGQTLPVRLYEKTFIFQNTTEREWSEREQKEEAERLLAEQIQKEEMRNAVVQKREYGQKDGKMLLRAIVKAEEDIAVQEKLLFNAGN